MNEPEKVATAIAKPMNIISRMASPFVKLLSKSTSLIVSLIGIKENNSKVTEEEIMSMVKEGRLDGEVPFYDFLSHFEKEELYDEAPYNTLARLILDKLEHIPTTGEKLEWDIFKLEIVDMDGARIDKVSVSKLSNTKGKED